MSLRWLSLTGLLLSASCFCNLSMRAVSSSTPIARTFILSSRSPNALMSATSLRSFSKSAALLILLSFSSWAAITFSVA